MSVDPRDLGLPFSTYDGSGWLVSLEYGHAGLAMAEPGICECCGKRQQNPIRYFSPGQLTPGVLGLAGWGRLHIPAAAEHLIGGRIGRP